MAIGNAANAAVLNNTIAGLATAFRADTQNAIALWAYLNTLGASEAAIVAALGAAPFNMAAPDPQNFYNDASLMNTFALIYSGAAPPGAFNYQATFAALLAGQ